jgi:hypothetical protein
MSADHGKPKVASKPTVDNLTIALTTLELDTHWQHSVTAFSALLTEAHVKVVLAVA